MSDTSTKLAQGDAIQWLKGLRPSSVDCVITDPPYESLEKHRGIGTTTRLSKSKGSSNDWFEIFPNERFPALFEQLFRVMKKGTHLYIMCDAETMFVIKPMGEEAGFHFWKPIIWDCVTIGMGYHYRSRHQFILFFEKTKSKRQLNDMTVPDILECKRIRSRTARPAEKPVQLFEVLVRQSTDKGQLICDPFMGSGATGVAALRHGRRFLGCDIDEETVEFAHERLSRVTPVIEESEQDQEATG